MIISMLDCIYKQCCFGWRHDAKEIRILNRIKSDIQDLTDEEIAHQEILTTELRQGVLLGIRN